MQTDYEADGYPYAITIYDGVLDRKTRTATFKMEYDEWPTYKYDYTITLNAAADQITGTYEQFSAGSESGTYQATKDS